MDRKGSNWTGEWYSILSSWVNSQVEGNGPSMKLSYVSNTDFLATLIHSIYESESRKIPLYGDNEELYDGFIKDYFPELYKEQKFNLKQEEQMLILLSLLMYVSCVQCQIKDVHSKCCSFLDSNVQEKLTVFFQQMESFGKGRFTKNNIIKAIQTSLGIISGNKKKSLSPGLSSNFFNSPTFQIKKGETKEINRLKNLLKEQNNEYNDLAERNQMVETELKTSQTECKILQQKVRELITENDALKEELNEKDNNSCSPVKKDCSDKISLKVIEDLRMELEELKSENEKLITTLSKSDSEVSQLKCELKSMELKVNSLITDCQHSQVQLHTIEEENSALKKEVEDLKNINEELQNQTQRFDLQNLSCPRIEENLGDVLLADKQNEIEELCTEMSLLKQSFEIELKEKILEVEELKIKELNYESIVKSKEETISSLQEEVGDLKDKLIIKDKAIICLREELDQSILVNEELTKELKLKCIEINELSNKLSDLECHYKEIQSTLFTTETSLSVSMSEGEKKDLFINELQCNLRISKESNEENKKALEKMFEENTTLKHDFNILSLEIVEKSNHIASTEHILISEREKMSDLNCELVEKNKYLKRAEFELESKKDQLMEKCNEVSECKEEIKHLNEKVSLLEQQKFQQELQLKEAHDKHLDDFNRLSDEHDDLSSKYKSLEESNKKIKAEYDVKLKNIEDQMILDAEEFKIREMNYECIINSKEETISSLQQEVSDLKNKVIIKDEAVICLRKEFESINEGLTKELKLKCSEINELFNKLSDLECRYKEIQSTLSATETSLSVSMSEGEKKDLFINELQSNLRISKQSNEENKKAFEKIVEENTSLKHDFNNLSLEIIDKNHHIASTEHILMSERDKMANLNCELVEKHNDLKRAEFELESNKDQLMEKCNEVSECKEEIEHLNKKVGLLEQQIIQQDSQSKEAYDKLLDDFNRLTDEHGDLSSKYKSLEESNKRLKAEYDVELKKLKDEMILDAEELKIKEMNYESIVKNKEETLSSLQQEVVDLKDKVIIKEEAVICLREEFESINEGLTKQLKLKCSEINELSNKLYDFECCYKEIQSTLSATETSLSVSMSDGKKKDLFINELQSNLRISEQSNEENKKAFEKIVEENTTLKHDFNILSMEIVDKNNHIASTEHILMSERDKMANLNCELVEKHNDLNRATFELAINKDQLIEKCNEVLECKKESECLNEKVSLLEQQIIQQELQLKEAYNKLYDDFNRLTDEHDDLSSKYKSLEESNKRLEESNKKLKAEYDVELKKIKDEMILDAEELKIKETNYESIVKNKEETISSLQQEVGDLKNKVIIKDEAVIFLREEIESINEGLTKDLEVKCSEINELSNKLSDLECRYKEIQSTLSATESSLSVSMSEGKKKDLFINELQSNLRISEQSNEENKKAFEKIVEENTTLKHDFNILSLEIVDKNNHIASTEHILMSERDKMANLNCELVEKHNDLKRAEFELESNKDQLMEKCNEVLECKEENEHLNKKVGLLEQQIIQKELQLKEAHDKLLDDFNRLSDEHDDLSSKYKSLEESNKKIKAEYDVKLKNIEDQMILDAEEFKIREMNYECIINSKEETVSSLQQEVSDLKNKVIIKDEAVICLRKEFESINEGLTKELKLKCSEINELFNKLSELECRYKEIQSTLSATETSLSVSMSEGEKKDLFINELQSNLRISKQSNEENKKAFEKIVEENTSLKHDFNNLTLEMIDKNHHIASTEHILMSERDKMANLNCELVEKHNDLKRAEFELESNKDQLMEKCNEVLECKEEIEHLNKKVGLLEQQIIQQASQSKEAYDKLLDDFNRLSDEHDALSSKYISLEESNKNITAEYEVKLKKIEDQMIVDVEQHKIKEVNYESIVKSKEETISSLQQKVSDLKNKVIIEEKAITCLREEIDQSISENEELTKDLKLKCNEINELSNTLSDLECRYKEIQSTLSATESSLSVSMSEGKKKDLFINELQSNLRISEQSNEENKKEFEKLVDENTTLKHDFNMLSLEIVDKNNHIASTEHILMSEREKMSNLNCELVEKYTDLKRAEYELESKKDQLMEKCNEVLKCKEEINLLNEKVNLLEKQIIQQDPQLKEAYDKLFDDFNRLSDEHDALSLKYKSIEESNKNIRAEYDVKLKKIKDQMKVTCTRAMQQTEENCKQQLKKLEEVIKSSQDHNTQLSSQLWDTSDKLIITKKENENLKRSIMELEKAVSHQNMISTFRPRTRSYEHLGYSVPDMRQDVDDSGSLLRRQTIRTVPTGMGKVFPSEDEAEEMFSNECLADLKAGHCNVKTDPDRVSTLRYRNSLCPPHLKSSYPAETQFFPIDSIQEDEIKGRGGIAEDTKGLPDKHRRKERSQTSYKKPGPPTPSKHGGRLSAQSQDLKPVVATPRNVLRELNDDQKKPGTPSRLFSQFFAGKQRGENTPTTPNQRRLSFFNKHFGKREGLQKNPE